MLDHLRVAAPPLGAIRQQVTADVAHVPRRVDTGGHRLAAGRDLDLAGRATRPHRARATKCARAVSDLYHVADVIRAYRDNEVELASRPQVTVCGDAS